MVTGKIKTSQLIGSLVLTILILGVASQGSFAQLYSYEIQTIPLKGDFINFSGISFAQDMDGFMWFGSTDGLYRYQGTSVKVFRHLQDNEHSLSDNVIKDLFVDSEGILWVGTENGLNRFDKYTESFKRYQYNPEDTTSIVMGVIEEIEEDGHSNLWIATGQGFCRFDRATETFQNYHVKFEEQNRFEFYQAIMGLYPDRDDNLWLMASEGVYRFHFPSGKIEKMHDLSIQDYFTWHVYIDRSQRFWINTNGGLYLYDLQGKTTQQFLLRQKKSGRIDHQLNRSMLEDSNGNIWVRSPYAIFCYNEELELKYDLDMLTNAATSQGMFMIKETYVDNTGSVWFYSPNGIHQLINKRRNFKVYGFNDIIGHEAECIHVEDKNQIWIGNRFGISSIDRGVDAVQLQYGAPRGESAPLYRAGTMYLDKENTLWIGMPYMGLVSMADSGKGENRFRMHIPDNVDSARLGDYGLLYIETIFEDQAGRLWIGSGSESFLQYYDRKVNKMIRLVDNPASKYKLPERAMMRHQTGPDTLWALGSSGVYQITLPFTRISEDRIMPEGVIKCQLIDNRGQRVDLSGSIRVSFMDSSGNIWLGTSEDGLVKINGKRLLGLEAHEYGIKIYNTLHGLPSNDVRSILPDGKGHLWVGTKNGLARFDIRSETFTNFFFRHGLPSNEFIINSSAIDDDGELFFGTSGGMFSFYPDSIYANQNIAPVLITEININNQILQPGKGDILTSSITYTDKLELPYNKNNLSLEYAILNYYHPELNQYKYKLEGFNNDWIYAGRRTNVDFTNLDPGTYTFRVAGSNNDGLWNEKEASLQVMIRPPPWKTWYAYIVYGLLLVGIVIWYRRYVRNRAKLRLAVEIEKVEKNKVQEIDQMKSRFFANISHEFRTPLTLIRGPLIDLEKQDTEIISMRREVLGIMKRNTERLRNLINQLLDISRMETGTVKLQVSEGKLESFLRTIILSFLSLAESKKIKYRYQLPGSDLSLWYDADKMEKIFVNLISNAFKFTNEHGEIRILGEYIHNDRTRDPEYLTLIIADTGIGIPSDRIDRIFDRFYKVQDSSGSETEGTGIGLALTKELVELYRGDINVHSIEGEGTTFTLRIPVDRDLFREDERILLSEKSPEPIAEDPHQPSEIKPDLPVNKVEEKNKPVVLIVEDNPDLTHYITGILEQQYRLVSAGNGKQGFKLAVEQIPELVISDLMMPVMDGMEMCGLIKKDERTSHIPVIMLTARADRDSKLEGLQTGADDYIIKPFDAEELQVRVKNLIEQRMHLRAKFRIDVSEENMGIEAPYDDRLMQKLMDMINKQLDNPEFNVDQMLEELNMSRTQLYRKVNAITDHAPKDLLRTIRLKRASALFDKGERNISQVMYQVGFNNHSYFARCFREQYKVNPSEYLKKKTR